MKTKIYNIFLVALCFCLCLIFVSTDALAATQTVFSGIAKNTGNFAEGLRKLAYVISGFGVIMFTFLAICGKINFKHLGYIFISLFFLSGVGALITYIKGGNTELVYEFKDTYLKAATSVGDLSTRHSSL